MKNSSAEIRRNAKLAFRLGGVVWIAVYWLALVVAESNFACGLAVFVIFGIVGVAIGTLIIRMARLAVKPFLGARSSFPFLWQCLFMVAATLAYLFLYWAYTSYGVEVVVVIIAAVLAFALMISGRVLNRIIDG